MKKKCVRCGQEFELKSSPQKYCNELKETTCKCCGKVFQYRCSKDVDVDRCPECIKKKRFIRKCIYCGKIFVGSATSGVCPGEHYKTCPVCGKQFVAPNDRLYDDMCCSKECANKRRNDSIKQVLSEKPKGYNEHKTVYTRICEWCGEEFTTTNWNQKYCKKQHYSTCIICGKIFPVTLNALQQGHTRVCSIQCAHDYGLSNRWNNPEVFDKWMLFKNDPEKYISENFDHKPKLGELVEQLDISPVTLGCYFTKHDNRDIINHTTKVEDDVVNFLLSIDPNLKILKHNKTLIPPYEIDFYLPDYNLGIEYNSSTFHNSSQTSFYPPVSVDYHKNKSQLCEEKGVFLFHIFSFEWKAKRVIIESMLRNLLGKNDRIIYARKCKVVDVSGEEATKFFVENHRQGQLPTKVYVGLKYKGELVSVMSFGPSRSTIGGKKGTWELVRFCSKLNTTVVGGASRLFKHFVDKNKDVSEIISFSDIARTKGNLYFQLGFTLDHISEPSYVWVDFTDRYYSRVNSQKKNIKQFLKDPDLDLSKSEYELMESHDYKRVYDCGTKVWIWRRTQS